MLVTIMTITNNNNTGFTIIEILTVVIIMTILLAAAIPGWKIFIQNNQANMIASKLYTSLILARTTAIQSGYKTLLCPVLTPNGVTCQNSTQWDNWIVFMDKDADNSFDEGTNVDTIEQVRFYRDLPASTITASTAGAIGFTPTGFSINTSNQTFNILPPGCIGNNGKQITIEPSGNIISTNLACP